MTRLEQLAEFIMNDSKWIDDPDNQKDAVLVAIREYLRERNDFIGQRVREANVATAAASEFDNEEVEETEACGTKL